MNLEDLYRSLSYGELSNLAMSNEGDGTITTANQPKIVLYANEALTRLYSKFILKESTVLVELYMHITNYHLTKRYARSTKPQQTKYPYIWDLSAEPFKEDVIRILEVYDTNGYKLPLNDSENCNSLFTPQMNILQVPKPIAGRMLSISYQAKHDELDVSDTRTEIVLPDTLHGALTSYIAYKVYSHMNTDVSTAKSQEHMALYEAICAEVEQKDLISDSTAPTNVKFEKRGWK